MPIEIRELQIRVTVNQPEGQPQAPQAAARDAGPGGSEKELIINQCIEQVLEILNNKKER